MTRARREVASTATACRSVARAWRS